MMALNKLEEYLDKLENTTVSNNDIYDYESFGYQDEYLFNIHLDFLLEFCYNIKIVENKKIRLNQKKFRKELFRKYNSKCIISDNDCIDEIKAAHIIPVADDESYDIDNGLLLTSTLHDTYDKYLWSINPETLQIEINETKNVGQIKNYNRKKINLELNDDLKNNLLYHYNNFKRTIIF